MLYRHVMRYNPRNPKWYRDMVWLKVKKRQLGCWTLMRLNGIDMLIFLNPCQFSWRLVVSEGSKKCEKKTHAKPEGSRYLHGQPLWINTIVASAVSPTFTSKNDGGSGSCDFKEVWILTWHEQRRWAGALVPASFLLSLGFILSIFGPILHGHPPKPVSKAHLLLLFIHFHACMLWSVLFIYIFIYLYKVFILNSKV